MGPTEQSDCYYTEQEAPEGYRWEFRPNPAGGCDIRVAVPINAAPVATATAPNSISLTAVLLVVAAGAGLWWLLEDS